MSKHGKSRGFPFQHISLSNSVCSHLRVFEFVSLELNVAHLRQSGAKASLGALVWKYMQKYFAAGDEYPTSTPSCIGGFSFFSGFGVPREEVKTPSLDQKNSRKWWFPTRGRFYYRLTTDFRVDWLINFIRIWTFIYIYIYIIYIWLHTESVAIFEWYCHPSCSRPHCEVRCPSDRPLCICLAAEFLPVSLTNEWIFNDLRGPFNWVENAQGSSAFTHTELKRDRVD